jgi:uncharacterized damage-inducible protein DinB
MSMIRPLTDTLKFNDFIVKTATGDLNDRLARRRLRHDGGTSIAWSLGHALHHRAEMAEVMGYKLPLNGLNPDRFARTGATEGEDYPALQELLAAWTTSSAFLIPAMDATSDAVLLQERTGLPLPHGEKRLLDALVFYVWHEVYHLGHIGLLRTHLGLTPLVNLVLGTPAAEPIRASA